MDIGLDEQKTHTEKNITLCELVKMKINIPFLKQPSNLTFPFNGKIWTSFCEGIDFKKLHTLLL